MRFTTRLLGVLLLAVGCAPPEAGLLDVSDAVGEAEQEIAGTNVGGTNLGGANVSGNNVAGTNLGGANLGGTNVSGNNVAGNNLGGTNLGGNNVAGNNVAGTNVGGTNVAGTNVGGTNVAGTNVAGSNLGGSNVAGTNVGGTNVSGTNLAAATLATANIGVNIHALGTAPNKMLFSGEDVFTPRTSSCVVLGIGSTAFAKMLAANPSGTMYTAIKKLPWGFSQTSGGPVTLAVWEALVWGSSKYCVFLITAPTNTSYTGVAGYVKSVWRWNAPPSRTMSIGQIGGGQTVQTHTGMMNAGATVLAGTISERVYVAGGLMFSGATTNDQSVQVDFASWVAQESKGNDALVLGRPTGVPLRLDAVYQALLMADGNILPVMAGRPNLTLPMADTFADFLGWNNPIDDPNIGKPTAKRCRGAMVLHRYTPQIFPDAPTTKCDDFSMNSFDTFLAMPGANTRIEPAAFGATPWSTDPLSVEYGLFYDSPNGRPDYVQAVPVGKYGCTTTNPYYRMMPVGLDAASIGVCAYPVLSETYVHVNEVPLTVAGPGGFLQATGPLAYKVMDNSIIQVTAKVTNVGSVVGNNWKVRLVESYYGTSSPEIARDISAPVIINGLAPGASQNVAFTLRAVGRGNLMLWLEDPNGTRDYSMDSRILLTNNNLVDDTESQVVYTGSWANAQGRNTGDYGNGVHGSNVAGASVSLTFKGSAISVIGLKDTALGTFTVSIDNGTAVTVSSYAAVRAPQQMLFSQTGLTDANHTIKLTKTNDGTWFEVDAFEVTHDTKATVDDTDSAIAYAGGAWSVGTNRGVGEINDSIHSTTVNGASASFTFRGTGISVFASKAANHGNMLVSIDNGAATTVDNYAATSSYSQKVFTKTGLSPGVHTIKVTKSTGSWMELDGFQVISFPTELVDDSHPAIAFNGTWTAATKRGHGDVGDSLHYTVNNGDSAVYTFTGTAVSLITEKNADRGNISVSVDGAAATTVNVYNATFVPQQTVFTKSGLANGTHTIKVTKLSGTYMDVDAFRITNY